MSSKENAEAEVLKKELDWLLKEEVHLVMQDIKATLRECYDCLPFLGTVEKTSKNIDDLQPQRILLTCPNGSSLNFKGVVTLRGDCVEGADIQFKHKQGKEHHLFKTKVKQGAIWKLAQIRDAGNHLCEALQIVSQQDSHHQYKTVTEVFMLLDSLMDRLLQCRQCLSLPKRKSMAELVGNQNLLIFNPPLPSDVAMSFYIHTSKLVLALYCLHTNAQHTLEITHRVQVEAVVKWLNEAIVFFSLSLQQCQQLKDKLIAVSQVLDCP